MYHDVVIPSGWKAVLVGGGVFHEWKWGTVSQNPVGFGICSVILASILGGMFWSLWIVARLKGFKRGQY